MKSLAALLLFLSSIAFALTVDSNCGLVEINVANVEKSYRTYRDLSAIIRFKKIDGQLPGPIKVEGFISGKGKPYRPERRSGTFSLHSKVKEREHSFLHSFTARGMMKEPKSDAFKGGTFCSYVLGGKVRIMGKIKPGLLKEGLKNVLDFKDCYAIDLSTYKLSNECGTIELELNKNQHRIGVKMYSANVRFSKVQGILIPPYFKVRGSLSRDGSLVLYARKGGRVALSKSWFHARGDIRQGLKVFEGGKFIYNPFNRDKNPFNRDKLDTKKSKKAEIIIVGNIESKIFKDEKKIVLKFENCKIK